MTLFSRLFGSKERKPERLLEEAETTHISEEKIVEQTEINRDSLIEELKIILNKPKSYGANIPALTHLSRNFKLLSPKIVNYVQHHSEDYSLAFLSSFATSVGIAIDNVCNYGSHGSNDSDKEKKEGSLVIMTLAYMAQYPESVTEANKLISLVDEHQITLSATNVYAVISAYDKFWNTFAGDILQSPLEVGKINGASVRQYLTKNPSIFEKK